MEKIFEIIINNLLWLNIYFLFKFSYHSRKVAEFVKEEKKEYYKKNQLNFYKIEDLTELGKSHHRKTICFLLITIIFNIILIFLN